MYIALGLGTLFIFILFLIKYLRKKRESYVREFELRNPEYIRLQNEHDRIVSERASLESDHPYQRLLSAKYKIENAKKEGNKAIERRNREIISSILAEYETTEEQLARACQAQTDAMNARLAEIEIKQRQLRLKARKEVFRLKNILGGENG